MALSNRDGTWTLTHAEYKQLVADSFQLARLKAAGVDNWEGYYLAFEDEDDD